VCCVSDLDYPRSWRSPAGLRVSPKQLEVDNGIRRSSLDKLFEDGRPLDFFHTGHVVHSVKHFLLVDGVVPVFLLCTSDLNMSVVFLL
jgi:hypothetical protein